MSKSDLLCFIALDTINFGRSVSASIENANEFIKDSKKDIIQLFFTKDTEKLHGII